MTDNPATTSHLIISGRVQGVGYRHWTVTQAQARNLFGWVRNRQDGSVEALLHGAKEAVDDMLSACYKGPAFANVTDIQLAAGEYNGPENFQEKPTV